MTKGRRKLSREEYIERCRSQHGDKYSYRYIQYRGLKHRITILCPKHGCFDVIAGEFLRQKYPCPHCHKERMSICRSENPRRPIGKKNRYQIINSQEYPRCTFDVIYKKHDITKYRLLQVLRGEIDGYEEVLKDMFVLKSLYDSYCKLEEKTAPKFEINFADYI